MRLQHHGAMISVAACNLEDGASVAVEPGTCARNHAP